MTVLVLARPGVCSVALTQRLTERHLAWALQSPDSNASFEGVSALIDLLSVEVAQGFQAALTQAQLVQRSAFWQQAVQAGIPAILLSDGRVFDGGDGAPFAEGDRVEPASRTAVQLVNDERKFLQSERQGALVLRTGALFSDAGAGYFRVLMQALSRGDRIAINDQLKTCPTSVSDLARVVVAMLEQCLCAASVQGVYHYVSAVPVTPTEFAEQLIAHASQHLDLPPVDLVAHRGGSEGELMVPAISCQRIWQDFAIKQLPWRSDVPDMVRNWCKEAES